MAESDSSKVKISKKKQKESIKPEILSDEEKLNNIFIKSILNRKLAIDFNLVGKELLERLQKILTNKLCGKCAIEGYIRKNSINILSISNGIIKGDKVEFNILFEADITSPVEGMEIICNVKNITKAGIRAEISEENNPLVIFVSRDHNFQNLGNIEIGDDITIRVIGQRYELNDKYISIIAEVAK